MINRQLIAKLAVAQPDKGVHALRERIHTAVTKTDVIAVLTPDMPDKLGQAVAEHIQKITYRTLFMYRFPGQVIEVITGERRLAPL